MLPVIPSMPISLIAVGIYLLFHSSRVFKSEYFRPFILFVFFVLLSMLFGMIVNPKYTILGGQVVNATEYNVKRTFQIIILFLYLFFAENIQVDKKKLKIILTSFIIWYLFLGILSTINLNMYFNIHNRLYGVSISNIDYYLSNEADNLFRFRYIFLDANTSIYFFLLVSFYLLVLNKNSIKFNLFLLVSNVIAVLLSQSTGATISFFLFYLLYLIIFPTIEIIKAKKIKINLHRFLFSLLVILSAFILIIILFSVNGLEINIDFVDSAFNRITNNDGGGRFEKYLYMFNDKFPFLWGEGYVLIREGQWFRPHSDILRMLYSYGIIAMILFIYMFKNIATKKGILIFLPAIIAFCINSLLDDQKIFSIFLLFYMIYSQYIREQKKELR